MQHNDRYNELITGVQVIIEEKEASFICELFDLREILEEDSPESKIMADKIVEENLITFKDDLKLRDELPIALIDHIGEIYEEELKSKVSIQKNKKTSLESADTLDTWSDIIQNTIKSIYESNINLFDRTIIEKGMQGLFDVLTLLITSNSKSENHEQTELKTMYTSL